GEAEPEPVEQTLERGRGHDAGDDTRGARGRDGGGHGPRRGGSEGGGVGDDGREGGQDRGDRGEGLKRGTDRAAALRGHGGVSNRRGGGPAARLRLECCRHSDANARVCAAGRVVTRTGGATSPGRGSRRHRCRSTPAPAGTRPRCGGRRPTTSGRGPPCSGRRTRASPTGGQAG